jgi:hypothetical protein
MAWNDPFETFVGATGQLYVAEVGTAFPTGFSVPSSSWTGLGYTSEDGVAVSAGRDTEEFKAWQSPHPIRRVKTGESFSIGAALQQWNEDTVPLALGGGSIASVSGGYEYTPPELDDLDERAMIADVVDGSRKIRILIPRGSVTDTVESSFTRGALAVLPVTFNALEPEDGGKLFKLRFSDSTAFAAGS